MSIPNDRIIWIDLEMTGLDTIKDTILEIATVVTESDLTVVAEGPVIAVHQPDAVLEGMNSWCQKQHKKTGLVDRVRASRESLHSAQEKTLTFLSQHVLPGKSPMAGNSICQDRRFMAREMPELEAFFHYRHLDVTSIKLLVSYWRSDLLKGVDKKMKHLALEDIYDSINELAYYRDNFLHLKSDHDGE